MRKASVVFAGVVLAAGVALALPTTAAASDNSIIKITNNSDWEIHYLFMSPTDDEAWGPDQLGDNVIAANGGTFELHKVPCDTYDIKIVDEDDDECVIAEVDICASREGWVITNDALLGCQSVSDN